MRLTIRKTLKRSWLAALAVVGLGSTALAAPIEVRNDSFESPDLSEGATWSNDLGDDWTNPNDAGGSFIERIPGFSAESAQHVGTQNGAFIYQNTGVAAEPFTTYTLIVGVGNRNASFSPAGAMAILGLTVLDGDAALSEPDANAQIAADDTLAATAVMVATPTVESSFEDRILSFTTSDAVPVGGITIFLGDDAGDGRSHFDNVRLYAQPAGTNIGPESEFQTASFASNSITVDGDLSEWDATPIVNARNRVGGDGNGALVSFEPFGGGTWDGPDDHSNVTYFSYDSDNVYVGIVVTDDYHENGANSAWNGDAVQLHVANAARDTNVALYNFFLGGVDGALADAAAVNEEKAAGGGGASVAIVRDGTTTTYEIAIPKAAAGLDDLSPGVQLGLGMTINDGDEAEPGQKGWGGVGTHSIVYNGKTPSETALVTLGAPAFPLLLDFAANGENSSGSAAGWVGVDNLVQDEALAVGSGVTLTALEDGFNPNNPAGPGADGSIAGITVPQNVLDDYLFKIADTAGTSAVIQIDGLTAGDWDITVFEGRTTDSGQFGKIWVGEEPAEQNTGDFAAGKSGTVTVTVSEGDPVFYRHLEDGSGGISGMIIAPATGPMPLEHTVLAGGFYYEPQVLTVNIGDTVNWVNEGGFHNVNFVQSTVSGENFNNPESFESEPTRDAAMYSHVFTVAGTYQYDCSVGDHAANGMVGTIIVLGADGPDLGASIEWADVNPATTAADLIGGSSVTFTPMTIEGNGNAEGTFFTGDGGATGNDDLDAIYNSHSWNAAGFSIVLDGLEAGTEYHIQLLGAGDTRGCCNTRTQTASDLNGNVSGEFLRGNSSVTGTFTATGTTQEIVIAGETDPGLSGYILADGAGVVSAVNIARPADGEAITVSSVTTIDSYAGSFDFDDGTTDLGDGSTISSDNAAAPASVQGGALRMTTAENGGGGAAFVLPPGFDGSGGWTMSFDFVVEHTGGNTPADGFSVNYGAIPGADNYGAPAEEGYGVDVAHVSYQVDTWLWDSPEQDAGTAVAVNGEGQSYTRATGDDANFKPNERVEASAILTWDPEKGASFVTTGLRVDADHLNIPTDAFTAEAGHGFSFLARTGGHNETVEIDNIDLQKGWTNLDQLESYASSFDFADGTTDLGDGSTISSDNAAAPASVQGGALRMTTAENGGGGAAYVLPPNFDGTGGWTMSFDFVVEHTGGNTPADGFSVNYGAIPGADNYGAPAEEGYGVDVAHVSYQVDTWLWDSPEQDAGTAVAVNGEGQSYTRATGDDANFKPNERVEASAILTWDPEKGASFVTTGLRVNADHINIPTDAFTAEAGHGFSFLARTGGHNETVEIDNIDLQKGWTNLEELGPIADGLLRLHYEFEEGEGQEVLNVAPVEGSSPLADGLIAYYPLDGDFEDKVGDADGFAVGTAPIEFTEGGFGQGIDLDGVDQYVSTPVETEDRFDFSDDTGFTVSAWFRVDSFDKNWQAIVTKGEGSNWRIHRQGDTNNLGPVAGAGDFVGNPVDVNDGALHHVVITNVPGESTNFYLDGVLNESRGPGVPSGNDFPMMIGENADGGGNGRTFNGLIDEVAVWDRALTDGEVAMIFDGPSVGEQVNIGGGAGAAGVVADSIADWAGTDEQGVNGWTYGYRGFEFGGAVDYDPADFTAFDTADGWAWTGTAWDWGDGNVPWTAVGQEDGHPNTTIDAGTNTTGTDLHHAIRRWTSDVEGDVLITYSGRETNLNGNGVVVGVHINGVLLESTQIAGGDAEGFTSAVAATLAVGDVVDCFLSPTDVDGTEADGSDGSAWSMSISTVDASRPNGLVSTTNANVWRVGNESDNDTLSVGGPGYMYFDSANGADATFVDTGMTPADLGIEDAPYTMMARVRQEGPAAGDGMIFGQATGEVLHNGSRDSVLYMGHWGADHGGGSVAFDQWRHISFVYDGADQIIYVDGTEVTRSTTGDKAGLGTGNKSKDNILIGLTRPDQDRDFIGCLDDVRIYSAALTQEQIAFVACESPRADCDGDGMWDSVELAVFGTLARDGTGDFDGDRLNDATEFALGTAMDNRDSDGDNLWDSAEVWGFRSDPLGGDTDGDGLTDDVEVAAGTDPTTDDTDRDGITDGDELANGPTTTTFDFSTDPGLELLNFSDGATPPEVRAEGGNPGGYLSLTDAENGARATIIFPDTTGGQNIAGFKFGVDARIGGGTPRPADGLSVSLVRGSDPVLADPIGSTFAGTTDLGGTEESLPEEGTRTGVSVGFDAWESGGDDIVGFSVRVDGVLVDQIAAGTLNGELDDPTSLQTGPRLGDDPVANLAALGWARFEIDLAPDGLLDVTWKGSKLVEGVQTNWTPSPGQLVFAARTGGANQAHHFDNLNLVTIPEGSADPLVFNEGAVAAGLKVHYEFDSFDAVPAPEDSSFVAAGADAAGPAGLNGQYWSLPPKAMLTTEYPLHRAGDGPEGEPNANSGFADGLFAANPVPSGTFVANDLNYTGNDLTPIVEWLGADGESYEGDTSETAILGDGLFRFTGYLWVPEAGEQTFSTNSDDGSVIYINNEVVVQHDNGHGQNGEDPLPPNQLATVNFAEAGYYPVDIRYFNGDWTNDAGDHGGANLATTGLNPANLVQSVAGAGGNVVTNLGNGPDGTLVGASLRDVAQTDLSTPTEVWNTAGSIPTMNNTNDGADSLDATWQAWIDFDAKADGGAENIFETGAGTIGLSLVYEAPSTLVMRSTGLGGQALAVASAPLSQADIDAGELHLIWTHDSNADGPETLSIWVNGEPRGVGSLEKGNDWSGGDGGNVLVASTNLAGSGSNSSLPGNAGDFVSGTADLDRGIQFFRDTLFSSGVLNLNGDGTVYVDTNLTAPEAGASGDNYTMFATVTPADLAGDNMVFGQPGGNVLHNGFRDAQFYQGHWGNDLGGGAAEVGTTYDVAWRYTAGRQSIYVNGDELVGVAPRGPLAELGNILVGATRLDQDRSFHGAIDNARIYSRSLSHETIRDIQGGSRPAAERLIVHYEFEQGISLTVENTGNAGAPDGALNSLDVISAYSSGSPSLGGPGTMNFDSAAGADATYIDTGLNPESAGILLEPYTMTAWVRQTEVGDGDNGDAMVFGQLDGSVLHNGARGTQPYLGHWGDDVGGGSINLGQWTHYAWTFDGSNAPGTIAIYQNGELVASDTKNGLGKSDTNIIIGTTALGNNRDFVGQLDDVRVYQGVLSTGEIVEVAGLVDSDGDGLMDSFERAFFGNLAMDGSGDPDGDGINNADEERLGLDPTVNDARFADADGDGWTLGDETDFGTNPDNANSFPSVFVGGGQWEVRTVQAEAPFNGLEAAIALLNGEAAAISDETTFHDFINFGAGSQGSIGGDEPFPGGAADNFVTHAKAEIEVTTTGDYTVSYSTDDGMRITIDGNVVGEVNAGRGAPALDPYPVRLTAGRHMVELIQYEQTGGDAAEFAGAINTENSLNGLGGGTVVLIPAAAPEMDGPPITSINFMGQQGADGAPGTPMGSNEITGVVPAGNWNNLGPAVTNDTAVLPSSVSIDFESDVEGLELINIGTGGMPEVRSEGGNPGGYLSLTDAVNSANASIIFPDLTGGNAIAGFTFGVDARIGGGTDRPADGMSINLVRPEDPLLAADSRGAGYADGVPEEGSTTGIGIGFDAWDSGNGDVVGFSVRVEGELVEQIAAGTLNGALEDVTSLQTGPNDDGINNLGWARFEVALSPTGELSVGWKGSEVISGLQTGWVPSAGQLVFGARTGGANQAHHFDNLDLSVIPAGAVIDSAGTANGIGVTWAANTMWTTFAPGAAADPTAKMMDGYLDDTADPLDGSEYSFVNLTGIPYSQYDIVAYFTSDGNDRSGAARVNGGDDTFLLTAGNNAPVEFIQATAAAEGDATSATYVWWQGLSGPEALVEWRRISNNVGLAGLQIIDTGSGDPRSALGAVSVSSGPLSSPTLVDFGELSGDVSYEFSFNAVKEGASTALAGNAAWALKLDQWNETGFIGTTEFGVADNTSTVPAVFGADTHVVFVSDTAAGETHIYVNGALAGTLGGNPVLAGMVTVMGATRDAGPIDVFGAGSVMHGWATYNTALSADDVAALAGAPFDSGGTVVYSQDFDALEGATDLADGSILFNEQSPITVTDGALVLTLDDVNSQNANWKLPVTESLAGGFTIEFDVALFDAEGGNPPADGFSINLGSIPDDALAGEEGFGAGLAVEFDTWNNGGEGADNGIGIDISVDGGDVATNREAEGADPNNNAFFNFDGQFRHVKIAYSDGLLDVTYGDLTIATGLDVGWTPADGDRIAFAARTGGANESVLLDNMVVTAFASDGPAPLNIAFVSFHDTDAGSADALAAGTDDRPVTEATDIGYTNLLTANGHTVTRVLTSGDRSDADDLNGYDLIIISRAVNSGHYSDGGNSEFWNTQITVPVMNLGGYTYRSSRLNWTVGSTMVDTDGPVSLSVADPDHPIFAGVDLSGPYANFLEGERGVSFNMDDVIGSGTVLATAADTPTAGGAAIFEFAAGAEAGNGNVIAGPRLAFLTGSRELDRTSQTSAFYDLTASGEAMFLNAVNYMGSAGAAAAQVSSVKQLVDTDRDGTADVLERLAGTDANDPSDYFHISGINPSKEGLMISFDGVEGHAYEIEFSQDLSAGSWQVVGSQHADETAPLEFMHEDKPAGQGFYRARIAQD